MRLRRFLLHSLVLCISAATCAHAVPPAGTMPMKVFRIYSDDSGASHIEQTVWLPVAHAAFGQADVLKQFFKSHAGHISVVGGAANFHAPPHNTGGHSSVVFMMRGSSTVRVSDGATRHIVAGDTILLEDTKGPGASFVIGPDGYLGFVVGLE